MSNFFHFSNHIHLMMSLALQEWHVGTKCNCISELNFTVGSTALSRNLRFCGCATAAFASCHLYGVKFHSQFMAPWTHFVFSDFYIGIFFFSYEAFFSLQTLFESHVQLRPDLTSQQNSTWQRCVHYVHGACTPPPADLSGVLSEA